MGKFIFKYKTKENISFWKEVYDCFHNEDTIFYEGNEIDKNYLLESFIDKFNIQKITGSKSVLGYEELINKLNLSKEKLLKVINVYCENCVYILVVDKKDNVLSILKSNKSNTSKIKELIYNNEYYKNTNYLFFKKGVMFSP